MAFGLAKHTANKSPALWYSGASILVVTRKKIAEWQMIQYNVSVVIASPESLVIARPGSAMLTLLKYK